MKKIVFTILISFLTFGLFAADTTSVAYKSGFSIGYFARKWGLYFLIGVAAFFLYRYFAKRKANS